MINKNPKLYFGSSIENDKAIKELIDSGIKCDFFPILEEHTPLLIDNSIKYFGLKGIREFLEKSETTKKRRKN